MLTTIGATYIACASAPTRAVAEEPTFTELTPKSFVKIPGAGRLTVTLIVSFGEIELETLTPLSPPPFLLA
jgi:hypothetical protein